MDNQLTKSTFFPYIQVLRAFAALSVVIGHGQHEAHQIAEKTGQTFQIVYYPFDLGIHIFFVISGFVIALTSPRFAESLDGLKRFLFRRFVRIVPLYWFYTSLMILAIYLFPAAIHTAQPDLWHYIQSYLFIPHESPAGQVRPVLSLGWTLNYEIFFYAVFACLMFLPYRKLLIAFYIIFPLIVFAGLFIPKEWTALHFWSEAIILEFLAGVAIAHLKLKDVVITRKTAVICSLMAVVLAVALYFTFNAVHLHHPLHLLMKGGIGVLLVAAATLTVSIEDIKAPRILMALGNSSYSLYLAHPFILGLGMLVWTKTGLFDELSLWVFVVLVVTACLIGAHIAYLIVEKPILHFLKDMKFKSMFRRKSAIK